MNWMARILVATMFGVLAAKPAESLGWKSSSRLTPTLKKPLARDPMGTTIHRLKNGLTVYLSPNPLEPRISAWIAIRAGSAQDPDDSTGMAHYLEHMMFKGSSRLGTVDYEKEKPHLDRVGKLYEKLFDAKDEVRRAEIYKAIDEESQKASQYAATGEVAKAYSNLGIKDLNAFTGMERTAYLCDLPKNRLEAWAKLEAERFSNPVYRLFQTEIETVYEEKNRAMDDPGSILFDTFKLQIFGKHPYGRTILGSIEHLKNPSMKKMYAFFDRYYVPNNMAVILSGDFKRKEALRVIEKYFSRLKPRRLPKPKKRKFPKLRMANRKTVQYEAEEELIIGWQTASKNHEDADALTVMNLIFDNSESGIINLRLNQAQKVKYAGAYDFKLNEGGVWGMYASPKKGQTLKAAEKLLMETIKAVKEGDFSDEDLRAIVINYEISQKERLESNTARVRKMFSAFIAYRDWPFHVDRLDRIRKITKADVVRVLNKYLRGGRVVTYRKKGKPYLPKITKPNFETVKIDASRESEFLREVVNTPAQKISPRFLKAGRDYQLWNMPSGTLYAAKNPVNDLFQIKFAFDRGRRHERTLCAAMSLLDLAGAGDATAEEFKRKLYSLGIRFSVGCGRDESSVSLRGLDKHFEEALGLMWERFARPHIVSGTLEKMVQIQIGQHKDNKVDPRYIARALAEYATKGKDSAVLDELSDEELSALKEKELVSLLGSVFGYQRHVSYVGIREPQEIVEILKQGGKKYLPAPKRTPKKYVRPERDRVLFVHRDMLQSKVGLFAADKVFDPKEVTDFSFFQQYMGGSFSGVVFQEIRESRALAYSAWAWYSGGIYAKDENRVLGGLGTQADKTIEATSLLEKLVRRLPPSEKRFETAQNSIVEEYRTSPTKFRNVPARVRQWRRRGYTRDPRPGRMERAQNYTLKDLVAFGRRFEDVPMTVYILGNRDRVDLKALKKIGELTEKTVNDLFPY